MGGDDDDECGTSLNRFKLETPFVWPWAVYTGTEFYNSELDNENFCIVFASSKVESSHYGGPHRGVLCVDLG